MVDIIKNNIISLPILVGEVGLEPTRPFGQ